MWENWRIARSSLTCRAHSAWLPGDLQAVRVDAEKRRRHSLDWEPENLENEIMKTTVDLPDSLMKQVKRRALREGRKFKDAVADLLRKGLTVADENESNCSQPAVTEDMLTGLPVIECIHSADPQEELTPERVAEILLAQEVDWRDDAGR